MQNQCSCCQLLKDASTASAFGSEQRCSSAVSLFSSPIVTPRTACSDHNVVLVPMEKMPLGGTKREGIQGYPQYSLTLMETWMLTSMTGSLAASNSPCVAILCLGTRLNPVWQKTYKSCAVYIDGAWLQTASTWWSPPAALHDLLRCIWPCLLLKPCVAQWN